ncbi:hypothetical protein CgunFtcFv8_013899 [Champsocephalus gunnari]|uniref:Uncharacterized protein n=1 Tax=Champsocephalus gunnari TaxID=52237 RepID=A0AAN8I9R5_CHAGU|nr:hypothetical protein CgunFtcFv8_013899 [Champsocephalus gunnari]
MSADSFHHVVGNSNSKKVEVVELKNEGIRDWTDCHSAVKSKKLPKLADLKVVQLRRGSRSMFVKISHEEEDFTELDFLQKKCQLKIPTTLRPQDKGIEEAKKRDIAWSPHATQQEAILELPACEQH